MPRRRDVDNFAGVFRMQTNQKYFKTGLDSLPTVLWGEPLSVYAGDSGLISSLHSLILQAFTAPSKSENTWGLEDG